MKTKGYYIIALFILISLCLQANEMQFKHLDINSGLSNNQVKSIFKDSRGFVWVGTVNGLNRFDGHSVKVFKKNNADSLSLPDNNINQIFEDNYGQLWIVTFSGLTIFDPETESFGGEHPIFNHGIDIPRTDIVNVLTDSLGNLWVFQRNTGAFKYDVNADSLIQIRVGHELMPHIINDVQTGTDGNFWVLNRGMAIEIISPTSNTVIKRLNSELSSIPKSVNDYNFFVDNQNQPWIYIINEEKGVYKFDARYNKIIHYHSYSKQYRISHDNISCIASDKDGNVLIGTDHGGLNLIDKQSGKLKAIFENDQGDKSSLSQNSITSMLKDNDQIIWIGTYKKGLSYFHPDLFKFTTYNQNPTRNDWLSYDDVNTFAEDSKGNLWIGTNGGGLLYFDRTNKTFATYLHQPNNTNSLSSNVIVDLCIDHEGTLWIGTYMGGLNSFDGNRFKHYQHQPNNQRSLSNNNVWSIYEDSDHQLWVGTLGGGISILDRKSETFSHFTLFRSTSLYSNYIMAIDEDLDGNLWFATSNGVDFYDKRAGRFVQYVRNENETNTLSSNTALDVYCDSRGWVWIATREGLSYFNPTTKLFHILSEEIGLPDNNILTILEANDGNLWIATPQGLSNLVVTEQNGQFQFSIKNYDDKDGLHGKEFNEHAALKTRKGELIFGGADGFSIFDPANLNSKLFRPRVILADLKIENKTIKIGQHINNRILLDKALNYTNRITLKHFEKTFSIGFSAINYLHPEKITFHYKLEGFNDQWTSITGNNREITYTNLHPGEYTLKLYASDMENIQQSEPVSLQISILPPFWKTKWAYSLYLIFVLAVIFMVIQMIVKRERNKFLAHQEKLENAKIHEMDMLKLKFFTNISHEFRTPLTLILSPLEKIIKTTDNPSNQNQLKLVQRNARRLLSLVNQLLDFRKLEVQGLTLDVREGELVSFCRETTESFSDMSESRNIKLTFTSNVEMLNASFDYDKIEKIIFNLLSNAFKFTPENGSVSVGLQYLTNGSSPSIIIEVRDTGIGIPKDKQELIFERFVQNIPEGVSVNKGSGIGLSLTREFIQMHEGNISVDSVSGVGSCFKVVLPLKSSFKLQQTNAETVNMQFGSTKIVSETHDEEEHPIQRQFKLMIVEDNPDIRFYLKDNLKAEFEIIEAANGDQAWDLIPVQLPDLVVSDIMMPGMDGQELCRTIKTDRRTSHIPVILLTARTADQQKYEGLENGADDYITKPFNFELLELRIRNMIAQREKMRGRFQKNFEIQPSEISITSLDEKFLTKVKKITEENMQEPDFSVEKLSSEVGISRAHLYNKLLALTGKTPIEYIRIMRIRRAAQLLEKSQLTVMEVAYKVGFNDPRYFTKHFKSEYELTPTQYIKKFSANSANFNQSNDDE